jgi:hypothetical protein
LQTRSVMMFTSQQAQNEEQEEFYHKFSHFKGKIHPLLEKKLFL